MVAKQYTIQVRVNITDPSNAQRLLTVMQAAAQQVWAVAQPLHEPTPENPDPAIAFYSDDFFKGHEALSIVGPKTPGARK